MAGHDEWQTPDWLFSVLNTEFHFDLDAAATRQNTKCTRFISPEQDALRTPWTGRSVWCNPPYSQLPGFIDRAWQQMREQGTTVVMLLPVYTDPRYWGETIDPLADEVRLLAGRLSFLEYGKKKTSARYPSCVVVFRHRAGVQDKRAHYWRWDIRALKTR